MQQGFRISVIFFRFGPSILQVLMHMYVYLLAPMVINKEKRASTRDWARFSLVFGNVWADLRAFALFAKRGGFVHIDLRINSLVKPSREVNT